MEKPHIHYLYYAKESSPLHAIAYQCCEEAKTPKEAQKLFDERADEANDYESFTFHN